MLTHQFSNDEREIIEKVIEKDKVRGLEPVNSKDYQFPPKALREHLKHFERTKDFVFLTMLESILSSPEEFAKFQEFVKQRREQ